MLPGTTVTVEDFHIDGGGVQQGGGINNRGTLVLDGIDVRTSSVTDGGGIYNTGTLALDGTSVSSNVASAEDGGTYNGGTLYLCGVTTFSVNQAPPGTENDISGAPAQKCPP